MPAPANDLAIVIPAFKGRFLAEALASIAGQTSQAFHVFVCDDGSPEDLRPICERALPPERLTYRRFEPNMGARRVVQHWNRSVQSAAGSWIWLFSDDDVMEPTCVETFLRAVNSAGDAAANVYRFNTLTIDADGRALRVNSPHPARESAAEFAYHRLTYQRQSYAPEYLFRRVAWEEAGGFVDFPFAQGSDDASWITFARDRGIALVEGPRVYWRLSQSNISGARARQFVDLINAGLDFAAWLQRRFAGQSPLPPNVPPAFDMAQLARDWMLRRLADCPVEFSAGDLREMPLLLEEKLGLPRREGLRLLLSVNRRIRVNKIKAVLRRVRDWRGPASTSRGPR